MELYVPVDWFWCLGVGIVLGCFCFLAGLRVGMKRERKGWLRFMEDQCRMSLTRSEEDPLQGMLKERSDARQRRLMRRDE